jgi:hypothetical protein
VSDEADRLRGSGLLMKFVLEKNGAWDHQDWLGFVRRVRDAGFRSLPDDEVGRLLEEEKGKFLDTKTISKPVLVMIFTDGPLLNDHELSAVLEAHQHLIKSRNYDVIMVANRPEVKSDSDDILMDVAVQMKLRAPEYDFMKVKTRWRMTLRTRSERNACNVFICPP